MSWKILNKYDMLNTFVFMYEHDPKEKWLVKKDELPELLECIAGETFDNVIEGMEIYFGVNLFSVYLDAAEEWRRTKEQPPFGIERKRTEYIWADLDPAQPEQILVLRKKEYIKYFREELEKWCDRQLGPALTHSLNTIQEKGLKEWVLGITNNFPNVPGYILRTFGRPMKPGKFLRKFNADNSLGKDILSLMGECFAIELRKHKIEIPEIKISNTPSEIYTLDGLHQSCMRGMEENTFELYDDISTCHIAYMMENENLVGRALLWDEVEIPGDEPVTIKLMDRIYFNNDSIRDAFLVWAHEHGYWTKKKQSLSCYEFRSPQGETVPMPVMHVNVEFTWERNMYDAVPYLDTFPKLKIGDNKICSYWSKGNGETVLLQSTEGIGGPLTGTYTCSKCNCSIQHPIEYEGDYYCDECFHDSYTECEQCGDTYPINEVSYVWLDGDEQYICNHCLNSRYNQSRRHPDHWWSEDRCMEAFDEEGKEITLTPDDTQSYCECAICGELHHYTNVKEDKYGDTYCQYCFTHDVKPEDKP